MATIEEFILRFKTQGQEQIKSATDSVKSLGKEVGNLAQQGGGVEGVLSGILGKLGPVGIAAGLVGSAFAGAALKAINMADALGDISDATGVSAGALNNLKNSLILAGGKADDFATLASRLNKNVGEAASGNEGLQKTFKTLGVYVTDANGQIRNTGDILRDAIGKLAQVEDPATRAKLAVELFGKEAAKLDFTKLNAVNDPFKDEQIAQLAKYRDAIDTIAVSASNNMLKVFGELAIEINKSYNAADEVQRKLEERGKTGYLSPGVRGTLGALLGITPKEPLVTREMTAEEKAARDQQQRYAEQARLMKSYSTRADTSQGGYGAAGPSLTASNKAIAMAQIESDRFAALAGQDAKTAEALKGANDRMAIDIKAANDVKNLQINLAQDIKKITAEVRANDKIEAGQQNVEIAAKTKELQGKTALEVQKIREKAAADTVEFTMKQNAKLYSLEEAERQANREALAAQEKQFEAAAKSARERANTYERTVNDLEDQILLEDSLRGMNETQANTQRQIAEEIKRRTDAIRELADIENLTYEDRLAQEKNIKDNSDRAIKLIKQRGAAEYDRQTSFSSGWEEAWSKYKDDAQKNSDMVKNSFDNFTSGLEDAFVKLVQGGKLSFKDLANSIIADLARIAFKKAVVNIGTFFGLPGLASGGPVSPNEPYIVGEKGPELFLPSSAGSIVPNNQLAYAGGSGMGGSTTVNYNIQAVDAASFRSLVARDPSFIYAVTEQGRRSQPTRSR